MPDTTTTVLRSPSDAELITLARTGDDRAYSELYQRHESAARAAARSLSRSKADVDDLVAEGFIRVLQALRSGKGPEVAFRPYLLTAIRNTFYDRTRKDKRVVVTDEPPEHVNVQLLDMAMSEDDRALIARAFAALPERWQLVLWHSEVEGQSAGEIGKLLDLAPNAVAALAYRAREGLRQAYLQAHLQREVPEGCRDPRGQLGGYVRNALSSRERRKVEDHLGSCEDCSGLLGELEEANNHLRIVLIPLLVGVPAAKYLAGLGVGHGLLGLGKGVLATLKRARRVTQAGVAVGSMAAAASIAVAIIAVSSGGAPADQQAAAQLPPAVATSMPVDPFDGSAPSMNDSTPESDELLPPVAPTSIAIAAGGALPIVLPVGPSAPTTSPAGPSPAEPKPVPSVPRRTTTPTTIAAPVAPLVDPTVAPTVAPSVAPTTTPQPTTQQPTTPQPTTPQPTMPQPTTPPTTTAVPALSPLLASVTTDIAAIAGQYAYITIVVENPLQQATPVLAPGMGPGNLTAVLDATAKSPQFALALPAGTLLGQVQPGWVCSLDDALLRCVGPDIVTGSQARATIEIRLPANSPTRLDLAPSVTASGFVGQSTPFSLTVDAPDGIEYYRQLNGGIASTGNSVMVCVDSEDCADARAGSASGSGNRRHVHQMQHVDIDNSSSFNSSMGELSIPIGATVDRAILVWSGDLSGGVGGAPAPDASERGVVVITGPSGQLTVTSKQVNNDGNMYVATADVTSAVSGSGEYIVANVQAGTGVGRYGGWALMVAYSDSSAPLSLVAMTTNAGDSPVIVGDGHTVALGSIPQSTSSRSGSLTWAVFEGDLSIGNESVSLNGIELGASTGGELFDSSVPGQRDPIDRNTFGLDIDRFDLSIDGGAEELMLSITSPGDRLRWGIAGWTLAR